MGRLAGKAAIIPGAASRDNTAQHMARRFRAEGARVPRMPALTCEMPKPSDYIYLEDCDADRRLAALRDAHG